MRRFEIGQVLGRTFRVVFANLLPFMLLTGVILIPQLVLSFVQESWLGQDRPLDSGTELLGGIIVLTGALLSALLVFVANGAIAFGVFQSLTGKRTSLGECVRVGVRRMLTVLGVAIVTGMLVLLGYVMLVIPGIMLYVALIVSVPAAVIERCGVGEALNRSRELTRGYRWSVFGVTFLLGLINIVIMLPAFGLSAALPTAPGLILEWFVQVFGTVLQATAMAVVYYELRSIKEPFDEDEIAAVFA